MRSTKTRIETCKPFSFICLCCVTIWDPPKQGLKLSLQACLPSPVQVTIWDPPKQGLKHRVAYYLDMWTGVTIWDPPKQGLKPDNTILTIPNDGVTIWDPPKQGLKQENTQYTVQVYAVTIWDPPKQGLKLKWCMKFKFRRYGHNMRSTKTRIETSSNNNYGSAVTKSQYEIHQNKDWNQTSKAIGARSTLVTIWDPPKQGLKLSGT